MGRHFDHKPVLMQLRPCARGAVAGNISDVNGFPVFFFVVVFLFGQMTSRFDTALVAIVLLKIFPLQIPSTWKRTPILK